MRLLAWLKSLLPLCMDCGTWIGRKGRCVACSHAIMLEMSEKYPLAFYDPAEHGVDCMCRGCALVRFEGSREQP